MQVLYKATAPCHIFGAFRSEGEEFTGPPLEGYDKETAPHLEVIGAQASPAPTDYSKMKVDQLTAIAADKGIDIPPGTVKAQIIAMLTAPATDDL